MLEQSEEIMEPLPPTDREKFLEAMRSPKQIPTIEISDRRRMMMRIVNPLLTGLSTLVFFATVRRWRMMSRPDHKWGFENRFDVDEMMRNNPKLYAYLFSFKCLTSSTILVGSATMALYFSTCTIFGIHSVKEFCIKTRIALQNSLPKLGSELSEIQKKKEEEFILAIYDYLQDQENVDHEKKKAALLRFLFNKRE